MICIHSTCEITLTARPGCADVMIQSGDIVVGWLHWTKEIKEWMIELDAKIICSVGYLARVFEKVSSLYGGLVWETEMAKWGI